MKLTEYPGLKFTNWSEEELDASLTGAVEEKLGRSLSRADPLRLFLRGVEYVLLQQMILIDECAKQNLLAYARGDNLEHLGALVGVERIAAQASVCTMKLKLSAARSVVTIIPAGVRFTAGDQRYFALDNDVIFLSGEVEKAATATCLEVGTCGNGYAVGEIKTIVDPQPFLMKAENVTESDGGSDVETDDALRERIHEAPESFSNAGSYGAYRWHTFNASALISDVSIISPSPGVVRVYPLLKGGEMPTEEIMRAVTEALNDRAVRPLTDKVEVLMPEVVEYDIDCEYTIKRSDAMSASAIELAAESAVEEYILWQKSALGRDIEPTELIYRLKGAGVKRVKLLRPEYRELKATEVGVVRAIRATNLGLEDD